jgi:hypothetical protein
VSVTSLASVSGQCLLSFLIVRSRTREWEWELPDQSCIHRLIVVIILIVEDVYDGKNHKFFPIASIWEEGQGREVSSSEFLNVL